MELDRLFRDHSRADPLDWKHFPQHPHFCCQQSRLLPAPASSSASFCWKLVIVSSIGLLFKNPILSAVPCMIKATIHSCCSPLDFLQFVCILTVSCLDSWARPPSRGLCGTVCTLVQHHGADSPISSQDPALQYSYLTRHSPVPTRELKSLQPRVAQCSYP